MWGAGWGRSAIPFATFGWIHTKSRTSLSCGARSVSTNGMKDKKWGTSSLIDTPRRRRGKKNPIPEWMAKEIAREKRTCMTIYLRVRLEPESKLGFRVVFPTRSLHSKLCTCVSLGVSICGNSMGWTRHLWTKNTWTHTHSRPSLAPRNHMAAAAHRHTDTDTQHDIFHSRQRCRRMNWMRRILGKSCVAETDANISFIIALTNERSHTYFIEYWIFNNIKPKTCMTQIAVHSAAVPEQPNKLRSLLLVRSHSHTHTHRHPRKHDEAHQDEF